MKLPLQVLQAVSSLSSASAQAVFPRPVGPYGVNVTTLGFTDHSRLDPFAPKPENRSVAVSIFYPALPVEQCQFITVPTYPNRTAAIFDQEVAFAGVPNGSLETVRMEVCTSQKRSAQKHQSWDPRTAPLVLFSPGLGLSRLWYSALAQSVASYGFNVVTLDHQYDADVVEYPDGRIVLADKSDWNDTQSEQDVNVRAKDASFVLDQFSDPRIISQTFPGRSGSVRLATKRAGIYGHSIGGATAATAMLQDDRFIGGVNLDGGLYGPVIKQGLKNPFMLFGHKDNDTSPTWIDVWPHLNWKLDIEILNSTHTTFTDIPLLAEMIFGDPLPDLAQGVVGHVPGTRARNVVSAYVAAFFKEVLACEPQALLQRTSKKYLEIEFDADPSV